MSQGHGLKWVGHFSSRHLWKTKATDNMFYATYYLQFILIIGESLNYPTTLLSSVVGQFNPFVIQMRWLKIIHVVTVGR